MDTVSFELRKGLEELMKTSKALLSYAGTLGLITMSQVAFAQTAPGAAPAAPTTPAAAEPAAPASSTTSAASATDMSATSSLSEKPAPAVIPPSASPEVLPAPAESAKEAEEPAPKKLAVAKKGWLQVGGLAQAWYVFDKGDNLRTDPESGKVMTGANYFRIRRAQLKLSGTIVPKVVEFLVLADFAKTLKDEKFVVAGEKQKGYVYSGQDTSPLLDFNITIKSDYADFTIGQWKSPISYEAGTSSAELILPERTYAARYFGDNYDMGFKIEKKFDYVKYSAQVLQGGTANVPDTNKQKELALRLEFYPIKGMFIGGAGLASVGQRDTQSTTREVIEVDAGYDNDGILVRGEMLWGSKGVDKDNVQRTDARGMSLTAAYTIAKTIQPAVRIGFLDVDETIDTANMPLAKKFGLKTDEVRSYEFGLNYLIEGKNAKVMAAYGYYDFGYIDPRHQVTVAAQVAY
jgi:hypothetical protein